MVSGVQSPRQPAKSPPAAQRAPANSALVVIAARARYVRVEPLRPALRIARTMRDPRFEKLADVLVNYSVGVKPGQIVRISGPPVSQPLVVELYRKVLAAG